MQDNDAAGDSGVDFGSTPRAGNSSNSSSRNIISNNSSLPPQLAENPAVPPECRLLAAAHRSV